MRRARNDDDGCTEYNFVNHIITNPLWSSLVTN